MLAGERAPTERWTSRDRLLAVSLTQLDASLCGGCGQPQWLGFTEDTYWDKPEPVRCFACYHRDQAVQAHDKEHPDDPGRASLRWSIREHKPSPGEGDE